MPTAVANSVGLDMPRGLPRANSFFKSQVCGQRDDLVWLARYPANVETEKNEGPNYLGAWRRFRRMTQEELAEHVNTTKAVISLLESGQRPLSAKWLRKLAPVLETSPGHLLDHDPEDLPTDVIEIWSQIAERDRDTARRVLESFRRTGTND